MHRVLVRPHAWAGLMTEIAQKSTAIVAANPMKGCIHLLKLTHYSLGFLRLAAQDPNGHPENRHRKGPQ